MAFESDMIEHKTWRIFFLTVLMFLFGLFFFLYKIEACKSTPGNCKDEFMELDRGGDKTCSVGATAEVVNSPPAPKAGILCHCTPAVGTPAASASH